MVSNNKLIEFYLKGFKDELNGSSSISPIEEIEIIANDLGVSHAILGDDVRSVDYLSNGQIIKLIKNMRNEKNK